MQASAHPTDQMKKKGKWPFVIAVIIALSATLVPPVVNTAIHTADADSAAAEVAQADMLAAFFASPDQAKPEVLVGMYTSGALQTTSPEIGQINAWLNENGLDTGVAIAGTFMDIEFPNPEWNIPHDLDAAWEQGAVPFINLAVGTTEFGPRSAADVANGTIDSAIRRWAAIFAQWSQGGAKRALIAPLQEMNASWVTYGLDPQNYKKAYLRIQQIFAEEGVPQGAVLWVFAPNGWSQPGHEFELYYPADAVVDVIGFSAFNFGACVPSGQGWDSYEEAIQPYLERMQTMAPGKPIFLTQTGTVMEGGNRGTWLQDSFAKLANSPMLKGIIYFNVAKVEPGAPSCDLVDWRVYRPEAGNGEQSFIDAIQILEGRG